MAKPRRVTDAVLDAICENLKLAMPLSLAAEAEGIPSSTIYSLRDADPHVSAMLARARATGAKNLAQKALDGEKGSSMAGWMLERRYRDDYSPPRKEEVQPSEVNITIVGGLPPRPKGDVSPP